MNKSAMHGESGYARIEGDRYYTPAWVTEELFKHCGFPEWILEPAAGDGAMVKVLERHGCQVLSSDIDPQDEGITKADFFDWGATTCAGIITNPPYSHAQEFIEHALKLMEPNDGLVAMLLRNEFDSAKKRRHLFAEHPAFYKKLVLTKRPRWFADGGSSPRHNFAWYIWEWRNVKAKLPPVIEWTG